MKHIRGDGKDRLGGLARSCGLAISQQTGSLCWMTELTATTGRMSELHVVASRQRFTIFIASKATIDRKEE